MTAVVIYRVLCAHVAPEHGHVTGLRVRKWRAKKASYGKRKDFSTDKVIEKIDDGAVFRLRSRRGGSSATIAYGPCHKAKCGHTVLRAVDDDSVIDDLGHLACH